LSAPRYHSFKRPPVWATPITYARINANVAMVHDATTGVLPDEYDACDFLYAEPPWRAGWEKFARRAGSEPKSYGEFLDGISKIVETVTQPTVIIAGKAMRKHLPQPEQVLPVILNGGSGVLGLVYRTRFDEITSDIDTHDLLALCAERYDRVGDFCCGYGTTAYEFARHGKRFVVSDVNAMCIGYIAERAEVWH
jgi:hypothetical protein